MVFGWLWASSSPPAATPLSKSKLPQPSGPHAVGFRDLEWQQESMIQPLLLRLFYPAIPNENSPWGNWIPHASYYSSYGHFLGWPACLSRLLWRWLDTRLWAQQNLVPLSISKPRGLIIFSHGLGGLRTTYSAFCCEMASQGWLVAALEHRDGSACLTLLRNQQNLPYQQPPHGEDDLAFRRRQLEQRVGEMEAAHALLTSGAGANVCWIHHAGEPPPPNLPEVGVGVEVAVVLAGHSFGAATAFAAAPRLPQVQRIIALDPWMFPLSSQLQLQLSPTLSCICLNSQTFHWPANWEALQRLMAPSLNPLMLTIRGTAHMDQSDLTSILPSWALWLRRPALALPPVEVLTLNHQTITAWLNGEQDFSHPNLIHHDMTPKE